MSVLGLAIIAIMSITIAVVFYNIGYATCEETKRKVKENSRLIEIEDKVDDILSRVRGVD